MYGYGIPKYAKEYLRDWQRDDRFLRLRRSLDEPGLFILERKTYRPHDTDEFERETDRAVQYKDGYRTVLRFAPNEIRYVKNSLDLGDIQKNGGAKEVARTMDEYDQKEAELLDRHHRDQMEALSSEVYDHLAWLEQRRVAMKGSDT